MERIGEAADFGRFYALYRPLVYSAALRILQRRDEAEDVVQTTFLKIWLHPEYFRGGNVESWLTALSKNCALDLMRRRRREMRNLQNVRRNDAASDTEGVVVRRLELERMHAALECLSDEQRCLVTASFLNGRSHRNIAQERSLPLGTVKTRIRSGLSNLRKAVGAES